MSYRVHSDSTAPVALPSRSNAENPYTGYGPIQSSSRCHEIKQNARNSNDSLHGGVGGLPELKLKYNNSAIQHGYPPSNGRSNQTRPVCLDDLSHGHKEGGCVPHTINENSNLTDVENFSQGPGQSHSTSKTGCKMSFFQEVGCRASTVQSTTIGSSFNDHGIKLGDRCDNGDVSGAKGMSRDGSGTCGGYTRPQNTDIDDMPIMNSGMTSAINHYEGKLLTPTASHLSIYHTGNNSGSMSSKSKTGSSHYSQHHLDINNAVKVLLKEPPENESSSCSTSYQKQSAQYCTTMTDVVTSCPSQSSSHSRAEQLWNSTKHYKSIMDNDVMFPQQSCRVNSMTDNSTPEVISASATDYVCDVSSISSDAKYLYPEVDKHLVPGKLSLLDTDWAKRQWKYARCFDKMLPRENPSEVEVVHFYSILLKVYDFTSSTLSDCLLEYYKQLCLKCNLSYNRSISGDVITQIQDVVMKSSAVYSDEYLKMCLLFMKYPFVYDFDWFRKAVRLVEEEYCIRVPVHPQNQNFVFSILVDTRIAVMNNRFKRVMLRQVGKVWYDKKQSKTKTVFGENALLRWERKSVFVEKHIFRGYIVSIEDVSRASTTEEVIRNIQWESNSREEFCQKIGDMFWEGNAGLMKVPPLPHSTNLLTSPTVEQAHHQSIPRHQAYHQKFHNQENNHPPLPIGSHVQNALPCNEYHGYCPKLPPISNHDAHGFSTSTKQTSKHQIPTTHQKTAPLVAIASCPDRNSKKNRTFINKDGSEIEQEWIEEFEDWLTIRVDKRWESNCE
jgi:hypothetical protein